MVKCDRAKIRRTYFRFFKAQDCDRAKLEEKLPMFFNVLVYFSLFTNKNWKKPYPRHAPKGL
jgi:hypothetical protein